MNTQINLKGTARLVLRDRDGNVKHDETVENLITTAGKTAIISRLASSPGSAVPVGMAIGTGTTAAAVGDTTLQTELDRNALTSNTASGNVLTMVGNWAAGDGRPSGSGPRPCDRPAGQPSRDRRPPTRPARAAAG